MLLDLGAEWWDARRARLVAHQAVDTIRHEAFLPAPNCRFAGVCPRDFCRAVAVRREQDDLCPPNVLLWAVPIRYDRPKRWRSSVFNSDTRAQVPNSHSPRCRGESPSDSTVRFCLLETSIPPEPPPVKIGGHPVSAPRTRRFGVSSRIRLPAEAEPPVPDLSFA
jgi:hypothetical protein